MKEDKITGKKTPESRSDEISLVFDEIKKFYDSNNGLGDKQIETNVMLRELNVSMGIVVDMLGILLNRIVQSGGEAKATTARNERGGDKK